MLNRRVCWRHRLVLAAAACSVAVVSLSCTTSGKHADAGSTAGQSQTPTCPHSPAVLAGLRQTLTTRLEAFRERVEVPGATAAFVLPDGCQGAVAVGCLQQNHATAHAAE